MAKSCSSYRSRQPLNINDLPDDLLGEILCRLPCPLAVRCKSVSKRWYALISSPDFIRRVICCHHRLSQVQKQQSSHVLFSQEELLLNSKAPTLETEAIIRRFLLGFLKDYRVMGESNGWLCCTKRHNPTNIYYVCNPLTNYWLLLPPVPAMSQGYSLGFLCDPYYHIDGETHVVTLNSECRFVVVRFAISTSSGRSQRVDVFSSSTGRWNNLSLSGSECFPHYCKDAVAFDGKLHFLGKKRILKFDPFKIQGHFIDFPEGVCALDLLITSSGSLGTLEICKDSTETYVKIWELKDYKKETWCLQEKKNVKEIAQDLREAYKISPTSQICTMLSSIATDHTKVMFYHSDDYFFFHSDDYFAQYKLHDYAFVCSNLGEPFSLYFYMKVFPMVLPLWHGPPLNYPRISSS